MKLINSAAVDINLVRDGIIYFASDTTFAIYRSEDDVKIRYIGEINVEGNAYQVIIKRKDGADDEAPESFTLSMDAVKLEDQDSLGTIILDEFYRRSPASNNAIKKDMPDWLRNLLRVVAVVIAVQAGNCARTNYQLEQLEKERAAQAN